MQTANIDINEIYALKRGPEVVRFQVKEIVTVTRRNHARKSGRNADTRNTIVGIIPEGDIAGTAEQRTCEVGPEDIIGHYTEYAALKAKQAEEERVRKEDSDRREAVRNQLQAKLYALTGIEVPKDDGYNTPFSAYHTNSVQINGEEAIAKVLALLEAE